MSKAPFSLQRFRFDNISANAIELEGEVKHQMEMKFEIGFHQEAPEDCDFTVTMELKFRTLNDEGAEDILSARARGAFKFYQDNSPREIEDPFERTYAVTALYGCMRPTLDTIINDIGLGGLNLPLSLPLEVMEKPFVSEG